MRSRRTVSTLLVCVALVTACQQDDGDDPSDTTEEPADEVSEDEVSDDDSEPEDGEMDEEGYGCQ